MSEAQAAGLDLTGELDRTVEVGLSWGPWGPWRFAHSGPKTLQDKIALNEQKFILFKESFFVCLKRIARHFCSFGAILFCRV